MSATKRERAIQAIKSALWDNAEAITDQVVEDAFDAAMAIMSEPEPPAEGMLRVRVCCAVDDAGDWMAVGGTGMPDDIARDEALGMVSTGWHSQFHWIEADVPAYAPPAEVTVKGMVVP
jgi:hypothetical protein